MLGKIKRAPKERQKQEGFKERFPKCAKDSNSAPFQEDLVLPHWLSQCYKQVTVGKFQNTLFFFLAEKKSAVRLGIKERNFKEDQSALCRVLPASIPSPLADSTAALPDQSCLPPVLSCTFIQDKPAMTFQGL